VSPSGDAEAEAIPAGAVTPDSSAVIAGFASWHHQHAAVLKALRGIRDLIAHVELESYSVLTRVPEPFQITAEEMADYLSRRYPGKRLVLPEAERRALLARFAQLSIAGGAVYDGLIAATAAHYGLRLISCDLRAAATYSRLGVDVIYV
jgi:predicted nucleic acid-binding protein